MDRQFATKEHLSDVVRTAFGRSRRLDAIDRLTGGTKKGVYRLTFDDGASAILYAWNADENYWPDGGVAADDPFADASGSELFIAAHRRLDDLGVRTPTLLSVDFSQREYPADLVLIEDVRGGTLEALIAHAPDRAAPVLARLSDALAAMAADHSTALGKVSTVESGTTRTDRTAVGVVIDRARRHLGIVADRVPALDSRRTAIECHLEGWLRRSNRAPSTL